MVARLSWQQIIKINPRWIFSAMFLIVRLWCRCADPAGGAAALSGAADGDAGAAAPGPAGLLQEEGRDRNGIFQKPGEAGGALHGQNTQHERSSAIQVC